MKEFMTLEQFRHNHIDDVIMLIASGGYVFIAPRSPTNQLFACLGAEEIEIPISWNDLKNQVVSNCILDSENGVWYLQTAAPAQEFQTQALSM